MKLLPPAFLFLIGLSLTGLAAPAAAKVHSNIQYAASPAQQLDIYAPETPSASLRPVFVYVHGGGWSKGDRTRVGRKPEWLSAMDFILVSVEYRLMPAARHPAAAADLAAALAWIEANIADFGGDPNTLFLIGHSTGGHMVSLVATDERLLARHQLTPSFIRGVICLDTNAFDLERLIHLLSAQNRQLYLDVFGSDPSAWRDASPAHHVASGLTTPPFLLLVAGVGESSHYLNSLFARRLEAAGVDVTLLVFPAQTHGSINAGLGGAAHPPTSSIERFARRLLESAPLQSVPR